MNIYIATFVKEKAIYIDENQVNNKNYPLPLRLAEFLGECGYYLDNSLEGWISPEYEEKIIDNLKEYLIYTYGVNRNWKTVYQNPEDLPKDVLTQKIHQLLIYIDPENINKINKGKGSTNRYSSKQPLRKGDKSEITKIVSELLSTPIPLGSVDNEILSWGMEELNLTWPEKIVCKEVLCMALSHGKGVGYISGVNDILRAVTYISYKDTTLLRKEIIKLTGGERRLVIKLLGDYLTEETLKYRIREAKKYKEKWSILSRILHVRPSDNLVWNFFDQIYHGNFGDGWGSKVQREYDKAGKTGSLVEVIKLFSQRPGELIRHYDSLLRRTWENKDEEGMNALQEVLLSIQNTRPKTLFDLYRYYEGRNQEIPRSYKNKCGVRVTYGEPLKPLDDDLIKLSQEMIYRGIKGIWGKENTLKGKKLYFNIPEDSDLITSCRTSGEDTVFPGEKIYFTPTGKINFFSQWVDPIGNQDLDIHAWFMEDGGEPNRVSWDSNFTDETGSIVHSGDVRFVVGNCEEYVSVDFSKNIPYTWMLVAVQNYKSPRLCDLENYIGFRVEDEVIYRVKVNLEDKNLIGFLVNLKEGYVKLIMEGMNDSIIVSFGKTKFNQYILQKSLNLKKLLEDYIKIKGGILMEEPDEETEILPRNAWELSKLLLD